MENGSGKQYQEGDWLVHTDLRRMAIFVRYLGVNGCRIKLLTGEYMLVKLSNVRAATVEECKRGRDDVYAKIEALDKFNANALAQLREKLS